MELKRQHSKKTYLLFVFILHLLAIKKSIKVLQGAIICYISLILFDELLGWPF